MEEDIVKEIKADVSSTLEYSNINGYVSPLVPDLNLSSSIPFTAHHNSKYEGDIIEEEIVPEEGYQIPFKFNDPFDLVSFFDKDINEGHVILHKWQLEILNNLGNIKPTSKTPYKYCLVAANGSGKDKFVIAPFAIWFILCKIRSRVIITTASGTQLTSQTEPYIRDLCNKVNNYFGYPVFHIRQRYIKCLKTGSEIRMFATDEAGKAEGYHPIDANSEMAIIVNEGKSVSEEIHKALRRCTGFNYWLEVSSSGEPQGYFYYAATKWEHVKYITSYDCPHVSEVEINEDLILDGEHSAFFRSKHLSMFTSLGGKSVIPLELIQDCIKYPPKFKYADWPKRIGIDLAAGGDETVVCITQGNKVLKEFWFREKDTVIGASRINEFLKDNKIPITHQHIYGDDGGIGRGIIDILCDTFNWKVNRIMNQWAALGNKKQYGNRGAENWYRIKRIIEEKFFDITGLTQVTLDQLSTRYYKQSLTGGRIFLESKPEAKAHGRLSPDRADAFILSLTGLTVDDFLKDNKIVDGTKPDLREHKKFTSSTDVFDHYENEVTFGDSRFRIVKKNSSSCSSKNRIFNSLRKVLTIK